MPDPNIFLWIAGSFVDAAGNNPYGFKSLLASGLSRFFIKRNLIFSSGPKSLPKNSPDCLILRKWVFDDFILAKELFAKGLRNFGTCVLVNINLRGKLFSSLESGV